MKKICLIVAMIGLLGMTPMMLGMDDPKGTLQIIRQQPGYIISNPNEYDNIDGKPIDLQTHQRLYLLQKELKLQNKAQKVKALTLKVFTQDPQLKNSEIAIMLGDKKATFESETLKTFFARYSQVDFKDNSGKIVGMFIRATSTEFLPQPGAVLFPSDLNLNALNYSSSEEDTNDLFDFEDSHTYNDHSGSITDIYKISRIVYGRNNDAISICVAGKWLLLTAQEKKLLLTHMATETSNKNVIIQGYSIELDINDPHVCLLAVHLADRFKPSETFEQHIEDTKTPINSSQSTIRTDTHRITGIAYYDNDVIISVANAKLSLTEEEKSLLLEHMLDETSSTDITIQGHLIKLDRSNPHLVMLATILKPSETFNQHIKDVNKSIDLSQPTINKKRSFFSVYNAKAFAAGLLTSVSLGYIALKIGLWDETTVSFIETKCEQLMNYLLHIPERIKGFNFSRH